MKLGWRMQGLRFYRTNTTEARIWMFGKPVILPRQLGVALQRILPSCNENWADHRPLVKLALSPIPLLDQEWWPTIRHPQEDGNGKPLGSFCHRARSRKKPLLKSLKREQRIHIIGREDIDHILRRCPRACELWNVLELEGLKCVADDTNVIAWIKANSVLKQDGLHGPTKFLLTCWYLWKWRNAICFCSMECIPTHRGQFLLAKFEEVLAAMYDEPWETKRPDRTPMELCVRWESPREGWVLLNTDGAVKGNPGPAACGGILRNDSGEWLAGFTEALGW
ncbi:LOW QUALITY PROTEIN: hypothetical protein Cgig2_003124 [Carnegiea gigantea]|uniref:RNase H type-1 domain-containing protein n=1 Tax=Carnegiea gigantea TaxID=171969 RepID=A0A9Q1GV44_9CARY|nr:LOW QUALITY PROTEIN: hypothetical protein Cgig2_003124 [Carnegiea gigantea]